MNIRSSNAVSAGFYTARGPISLSITGLFFLGVLYTLYFASALLVPFVFTVILSFLLAPAVRWAERFGMPRLLTASFLVLLIVSSFSFVAYSLSGPAAEWLSIAPTSIREVRAKFQDLDTPLTDVREAAEAVEEAVQDISGQAEAAPEQVVEIRESGWLVVVIGQVPYLLASFIVSMVLTIFLLAWADDLTNGFAELRRGFGIRRRTIVTIAYVQRDVARYLATVATINLVLGIVVWLAMLSIGMPNAPLWGAVAGVANFAPYIGAVCTAGALLLAGASAFDTWQAALVPSLVFCLITMFEGQIFTPAVLGHRLSVPPPVVLIAVLFFGWLWGIVGALIAVPLLIIIRRVWLQSRAYQRSRTVEKSGSPYPVERLATRKTVISLAAD